MEKQMQLILRKKVENAIKSLFYELDDVQRARLEAEFSLVEKYGMTELFYIASAIYDELYAHDIECKLCDDSGYAFSYILFILGVSPDNPLDYPQIDTLARIEKEFSSHSPIIIQQQRQGRTFRICAGRVEVSSNAST